MPLPWIQHCDILQHAWQEKHLQAMAPILISLHVFIIHFGLLLLPDDFRSPRNTRCLPPNFTQEILLGKLLLGVFEKKKHIQNLGAYTMYYKEFENRELILLITGRSGLHGE